MDGVKEKLYTGIRDMDEKRADAFVKDAPTLGCRYILIVVGFLCKGLSRNRGINRPN